MALTPEKWTEVKELFEAALEHPSEERSSFLRRTCTEETIFCEVERLLANHTDGSMLRIGPLGNAIATDVSNNSQTFSAGQTVASRFKVIQFLARGGMGEVYEAEDLEFRQPVALKTIRPEVVSTPHALERFKREVQLAKKVTHANVCRIFDLFRHAASADTTILLVSMELLRGETLAEYLRRVGRLSIAEAVSIALQMANGLGAAHEMGILHRDFKPGNVVLVEGKKGIRAVITDFGLALQPDDDAKSSGVITTTVHFGTPAYMSPEQVEGRRLTPASDVYSLGLVLYEMVTGARPFEDSTPLSSAVRRLQQTPAPPRTLVPDLDRKWDTMILRCLERTPDSRFATADNVANAIKSDTPLLIPKKRGKVFLAVSGCVIALILIALAWTYYRSHRQTHVLTDKDTIVLADFANSTGDAVFDDTLKTALAVSLRQSPFLDIISDNKVAATLRLMARPGNTPLTPDVAREVCQRAASKAYIAGSIAALGKQYVLKLEAVNCTNGDLFAEEQATATAKEKVLGELGKSSSRLRRQLGESLLTVQKYDVPLSEATTSSLDALKAYSLGAKVDHERGPAGAVFYHQRAIELDPNFAMGYSALGSDYFNLGQLERASEYHAKAFQLRQHASERERLQIAALFYKDVTGELDKAAQTYEEEIDSYPRNLPARKNLGVVYSSEGQYEKAREIFGDTQHLAPDNVGAYDDFANCLLALQHFDEAQQIIRQAETRKLDDSSLHNTRYALAFLAADSAAMAEQLRWYAGRPEEYYGLSLAANTEAYAGHFRKARELSMQSMDSAARHDSKENGAIALEDAALRDAAAGNAMDATREAARGLKAASATQGVQAEAALAYAMVGDTARAESLAQNLDKRYPLDTQMQALWLPAIRAQLALNRRDAALALNTLQAASAIEFGNIAFAANISCLYPTYLRGEAYLAAGEGKEAVGEFQKILDHGGLIWNCWTGALAHLGAARANALEARTSKEADADAARARAISAYKSFLTLWKDADPETPILKEAKAEYGKLQ